MTSDAIVPTRDDGPLGRLLAALERALSEIPRTDEPESRSPEERARGIARSAAIKAAVLAGGLALPPGPLGYVTIIPDLVGIWKIQAQMVADMAGAFGKRVYLGREQMLYCLFRHAAAQAMRDVVVRVGERMLIRRPALGVVERVLARSGFASRNAWPAARSRDGCPSSALSASARTRITTPARSPRPRSTSSGATSTWCVFAGADDD